MAEKRHSTIIIVPHAHGKVFKIQLSPILLKALMVLGIVVAITAIVSLVASGTFLRQRAMYRALQRENKQLKTNNQRLEQTIGQVQARLSQFEQRTKALAIAAGVANLFSDSTPTNPGGMVGSGGPLNKLAPEPSALLQRQDRLDQDLAKVEQRLSDQAMLVAHTPVLAPVMGVITDGFGPRIDPFTHRPAFHDGLDISVAYGTVVTAPADGVVVYAERDAGYGRLLKINHGFGYTTMYGHLEQFLVKEGDHVTRGEPIAKVGMSGRTTGPHLHYEVWKDGEKQNPLYYILDAF